MACADLQWKLNKGLLFSNAKQRNGSKRTYKTAGHHKFGWPAIDPCTRKQGESVLEVAREGVLEMGDGLEN